MAPDWQRFACMLLGACHSKATRVQQGLRSTSTCPTDWLCIFCGAGQAGHPASAAAQCSRRVAAAAHAARPRHPRLSKLRQRAMHYARALQVHVHIGAPHWNPMAHTPLLAVSDVILYCSEASGPHALGTPSFDCPAHPVSSPPSLPRPYYRMCSAVALPPLTDDLVSPCK